MASIRNGRNAHDVFLINPDAYAFLNYISSYGFHSIFCGFNYFLFTGTSLSLTINWKSVLQLARFKRKFNISRLKRRRFNELDVLKFPFFF